MFSTILLAAALAASGRHFNAGASPPSAADTPSSGGLSLQGEGRPPKRARRGDAATPPGMTTHPAGPTSKKPPAAAAAAAAAPKNAARVRTAATVTGRGGKKAGPTKAKATPAPPRPATRGRPEPSTKLPRPPSGRSAAVTASVKMAAFAAGIDTPAGKDVGRR